MNSPSFEQVLDAQNNAIQIELQHWLKYELPSIQFWILLAMLIVPWIIWWKLVDKKRLLEIFVYGLLISAIVTFLDEVGCQLNLWEYRYDIEPYFPRLIPMNFAMLPVIYMLIYQYFPKWKQFVLINFVLAATLAFIGEPIFVMLKIYVLINWQHYYSYPIYIVLAVAVKALTLWFLNNSRRA